MELTASAPGKLFVIGEYGVLHDGPGVLAAVDRRLRCRVIVDRGSGRFHLRNGESAATVSLDGDPTTLQPPLRFAGVAAVAAARHLGLRTCDIRVETESALDRMATKRGLGGSAAVTAATIAALYRAAGRAVDASDARERAALGVEAHRLAQGSGSGADVVVATVGGLVLVKGLAAGQPGAIADPRDASALCFEHLALPAPLALEVVGTATPAASGPRAARFAAAAAPPRITAPALRAWLGAMREAVELFAAACRRCDPQGVRAAFAQGGRLLERLAPIAAIPVLNAELRRAQTVARELGADAKPSGAGGGDCAITLVEDTQRAILREAWQKTGLEPLALSIASAGARVEPAEAPAEEGLHGTL